MQDMVRGLPTSRLLYLLTAALVFFLEVTLRVNLLGRSSIQWFVVLSILPACYLANS